MYSHSAALSAVAMAGAASDAAGCIAGASQPTQNTIDETKRSGPLPTAKYRTPQVITISHRKASRICVAMKKKVAISSRPPSVRVGGKRNRMAAAISVDQARWLSTQNSGCDGGSAL